MHILCVNKGRFNVLNSSQRDMFMKRKGGGNTLRKRYTSWNNIAAKAVCITNKWSRLNCININQSFFSSSWDGPEGARCGQLLVKFAFYEFSGKKGFYWLHKIITVADLAGPELIKPKSFLLFWAISANTATGWKTTPCKQQLNHQHSGEGDLACNSEWQSYVGQHSPYYRPITAS